MRARSCSKRAGLVARQVGVERGVVVARGRDEVLRQQLGLALLVLSAKACRACATAISARLPAWLALSAASSVRTCASLACAFAYAASELGRIEPEQQLAGRHRLVVIDQHLGHAARDLGADRDAVGLDIGVVGLDIAPAAEGRRAASAASSGRRPSAAGAAGVCCRQVGWQAGAG